MVESCCRTKFQQDDSKFLDHSAAHHAPCCFFSFYDGNKILFRKFVSVPTIVILAVCFDFIFCPVHPKPAPYGSSVKTVLVVHHVNSPSGSVLLMLWVIIMLWDEPLLNQSSSVTCLFLTILITISRTTSCGAVLY